MAMETNESLSVTSSGPKDKDVVSPNTLRGVGPSGPEAEHRTANRVPISEMPSNPMDHDRFIPEAFQFVGKRGVRRIDGYKKASGEAVYTRDITLSGMLYAKFMTSPYPNARIISLDTSRAESLPGVRAVLRYDDPEIAGKKAISVFGTEEDILPGYTYFQGQQVGVVVAAETEEIADQALKLIKTHWEKRPFFLDGQEALKPGAPLTRPEWLPESNEKPPFQPSPILQVGDIEKGFGEADQIIEFKARRRYHGCPDAEMLSGISKWEGDCVELWLHHQHPFEHKWVMKEWFGLPMSKVKVNCPYNGAMFGGWNFVSWGMMPQYMSAILAKRTRKPVKWIFNRRDDFTFGAMDVMNCTFRVGVKLDGTITAVKIKSYFENMSYEPAEHLLENTRIPHIYSETILAQVNKGPVMALRCEQLPPSFCFTHIFSHAAAALDMDPIEVALKNDGVEGRDMDYLAAFKEEHGFPARDSLRECIEKGKAAIDWEKNWHPPGARRLPNGKMHGLGFTWDHEWDDGRGAGAAGLLVQQDGSVNIIAFRADVGVNAETTYCQIVAEELGVPIEQVHFRHQDDVYLPLMTPDGSCNLTTNGYVMKKVAKLARQKLLERATTAVDVIERVDPPAFPGFNPEDLDIKDGIIFVKADPSIRKKVSEVTKDVSGSLIAQREYASIQNTTREPVYVWAYHRQGRFGTETGRHRLCRQAHFMEIEVDTETGEIDIKRVVNVNDVGKVMSPEGAEGQQYGGTYMALGRGRSEEFIWDEPTGVLLNGNLLDYKIATMLDCGPIDPILVETGLGYGPYGSVGIGEDIATVVPALLGPAVYNALGVWVDDFPITPDKVLKALGKG